VLAGDEGVLLDGPVQRFLVAHREAWLTPLMRAATDLGAWLLSDTIKTLTHRARPPAAQAIGHWTGYAFPSGHTTKATATYGLLVATTPRWGGKVAGWTAALLLAGLVALSRLYLGASWLTDVLGAAWLFALLTATRVVGGLQGHTAATHPPRTGRQPAQAAPVATPANDHRPARPKQHGG
jgi:undecaprenyl-diphosphatase